MEKIGQGIRRVSEKSEGEVTKILSRTESLIKILNEKGIIDQVFDRAGMYYSCILGISIIFRKVNIEDIITLEIKELVDALAKKGISLQVYEQTSENPKHRIAGFVLPGASGVLFMNKIALTNPKTLIHEVIHIAKVLAPKSYTVFKNMMNGDIVMHKNFKLKQEIIDDFEFFKIEKDKRDDEFLAYFFSDNTETEELTFALTTQLLYGSHISELEGELIMVFNLVNDMFEEMEDRERKITEDNMIDIEINEATLNSLFNLVQKNQGSA
jgi:hypothetical protein